MKGIRVTILLLFQILSFAFANEITNETTCILSGPLGASWTFCTLELHQHIQNRSVTVGNIHYKYDETEKSGSFSITGFKIDSQVVLYMPKIPSFTEVEKISITNSRLLEIHSEDLQPYPGLMTLNLTGNSIQRLEKDLFQHTTNIRNLDLSFNRIKFIHQSVFDSLTDLDHITLKNNLCIDSFEGAKAKFETFFLYAYELCSKYDEQEMIEKISQLEKLIDDQQKILGEFKNNMSEVLMKNSLKTVSKEGEELTIFSLETMAKITVASAICTLLLTLIACCCCCLHLKKSEKIEKSQMQNLKLSANGEGTYNEQEAGDNIYQEFTAENLCYDSIREADKQNELPMYAEVGRTKMTVDNDNVCAQYAEIQGIEVHDLPVYATVDMAKKTKKDLL